MEPALIEKKYRRRLQLTRFLNAYLPLSIMRFLINKSVNRVHLPADVTREEIFADTVRCEWLKPQKHSEKQVLLYLHGGGFILGLTSLHLEMIAYLVQKMGIPSLVVDYRTAPKYPFPGALDDCVQVYRWLIRQGYKPKNIVFAGDSAGGNLTITSLMKLRDDGDPLPAAAACLSPVADMAKKKNTYSIKYDPVLHPRAGKRYNRAYIGKSNPKDPLISPVYGSLKELPPLLIHAGENEVLKDDAIQIEQKAKNSGVNVQLEVFPGMWHVWQIYHELPQTIDSLDKICDFFNSYLN